MTVLQLEIGKMVTAMGGVLHTKASLDVSFIIVKNVLAAKYKVFMFSFSFQFSAFHIVNFFLFCSRSHSFFLARTQPAKTPINTCPHAMCNACDYSLSTYLSGFVIYFVNEYFLDIVYTTLVFLTSLYFWVLVKSSSIRNGWNSLPLSLTQNECVLVFFPLCFYFGGLGSIMSYVIIQVDIFIFFLLLSPFFCLVKVCIVSCS